MLASDSVLVARPTARDRRGHRLLVVVVAVLLIVSAWEVAESLIAVPVRDELVRELALLPSPPQSTVAQQSTIARLGEAAATTVYNTDLPENSIHEFYRQALPGEGFLARQQSRLGREDLSCFLRGQDWLSVETTSEVPRTFVIRLARWRSLCA